MVATLVRMAALSVALLLSSCQPPKAELLDAPITAELRRGMQSGDESFDHSTYDALVREHVDPRGHVDYGALKNDEAKLDAYLRSLARADLESLSTDEQLALLINAYNAFTLRLILDHYPNIESIRDIDDPWTTRRWVVGGHTLSLDDVEHGLIRPLFDDPRIHFAVNCASLGCPPLRRGAYTGAGIDEQLDEATRRALSDPRWARVENGTVKVTKVLDWYGSDFDSVPDFVARHASPELGNALKAGDLEFLDYDWSLNVRRPPPP